MTLVMVWPNKKEGATALHIASDSLLSVPRGATWPYAIKIFRIYPSHDYLAYCGTTQMVVPAIAQWTGVLAATSVLGRGGAQITARSTALCTLLSDAVKEYPKDWASGGSILLYGSFDQHRNEFRLFKLSLTATGVQKTEEMLSQFHVRCFGSGATKANLLLKDAPPTRAGILRVLKAVIDDPLVDSVGGVPQMVTIRKRGSQLVGFNWKIKGEVRSTLFGLPLHFHSKMQKVKFLDENFRSTRYLGNPQMKLAKS